MLIIPITNKIDWKHPPLMTICIIIACTFVHFVLQSNDRENQAAAQRFYYSSGLLRIEVNAYIDYLNIHSNTITTAARPLSKKALNAYGKKMFNDKHFMYRLLHHEIIQPGNPQFSQWDKLRTQYNQMLEQVISFKYGFKPAYSDIPTLFTSLFLHGGIGHILGNMIFLWLVGCILEAGCGRYVFLASYLFTGIMANLLFKVIYWESIVPLVGASGAISGMMGMLAILFGKKRIKIFYSLGFFFSTIKISALIVFFGWVTNELVQLFFNQTSNIAYVAHIGGLLSGAFLAVVFLKIPGVVNTAIFDEDPKENANSLIETALQKKSQLDLQAAENLLQRAIEKDPENPAALRQLLNLYLHSPDNQKCHHMAEKVISQLIGRPENQTIAIGCFTAYKTAVKTVRLSPALLIRLSFIFCDKNDLKSASGIVASVSRHNKKTKGLPQAWLKLSLAYKMKGQMENFKKCRTYILNHFPNSQEARTLSDL